MQLNPRSPCTDGVDVNADDSFQPSDDLQAISHESRTALSTLQGYVEIVQEELGDRGIALPDEFAHLEGALSELLHAISRLEEHATRAGLAASVDVLTGLPNRRYLFEVGERWMRADQGLCAILLDLDEFKWVNDRYGHHTGDLVLVELAKRLRGALRSDDLVCRLAGDEFVVLLPQADLEIGEQVAGRIRSAVRNTPFTTEEGPLDMVASLGVAVRKGQHTHLEELLREADRAMYRTKRSHYDERKVHRLREKLTPVPL